MPRKPRPAAEKPPQRTLDELLEESRLMREKAAELAERMRELAEAISRAAEGRGRQE
jgi:hypothetical protein